MTVQVSTKFKERILGAESFADIFAQGRILLYSGAQPESADFAVTGDLLAQVTLDGQPWTANGSDGGLIFELLGSWAIKPPTATWKLIGSGTGTAGWFRLVGAAEDTGDLSNASPRIDGTVDSSGTADFYLATLAITPSTSLEIQQFNFTFPPI